MSEQKVGDISFFKCFLSGLNRSLRILNGAIHIRSSVFFYSVVEIIGILKIKEANEYIIVFFSIYDQTYKI